MSTQEIDWEIVNEESPSIYHHTEWNKTEMFLYPGAYCTYKTTHDTKVDFDPLKVDVSYYKYEGNSLPFGMATCRLTQKTRNNMFILDNVL